MKQKPDDSEKWLKRKKSETLPELSLHLNKHNKVEVKETYDHDKMLRDLELRTKRQVDIMFNQVKTHKSIEKKFHDEQKRRISTYMIDPRRKDNVLTMKKLKSMPTIDFESFKNFSAQPNLIDKLSDDRKQDEVRLPESPIKKVN